MPFNCQIDVSNLPAEHVVKPSRCLGIFLMIFSLLWGGIPAAALLYAIITGQFEAEMLFLLIFAVSGAALFAAGLWTVSHRKEIRIDENNVSVVSHSVFSHKLWQEPLDRYKGVLARSQYHSGGKNSPSYTLYIAELFHEDRKKKIRLYESRSDEDFRKIWKDYARQLSLPALEKEGKKMIAREVGDLDKSVGELAAEGKLEFFFDPDRSPPAGFDVEVRGNALCVGLPKRYASATGLLIGLVIPAIFVYLGFWAEKLPAGFGIAGLLFLLLMAAGAAWLLISRTMVAISPGLVHIFHRTPWGDTGGKELPSEGIETVRVGRATERQGRNGVMLATGEKTETLGEGLSEEKLEWLKNCILAVITSENSFSH